MEKTFALFGVLRKCQLSIIWQFLIDLYWRQHRWPRNVFALIAGRLLVEPDFNHFWRQYGWYRQGISYLDFMYLSDLWLLISASFVGSNLFSYCFDIWFHRRRFGRFTSLVFCSLTFGLQFELLLVTFDPWQTLAHLIFFTWSLIFGESHSNSTKDRFPILHSLRNPFNKSTAIPLLLVKPLIAFVTRQMPKIMPPHTL